MKYGSLAVLALSATTLSAATRLVTTSGADSGNCTVTPCATFTYAIAQAANGDTISAGAGTFDNGGAVINVTKSVTLAGAQAGVDARSRIATESVLTVPVQLTADNAALDGFTVTCGNCNPFPCAPCTVGVATSAVFSGYRVQNNIVTGNQMGLSFGSSGATASTMSFNDVHDNSLYGVFTDVLLKNAAIDQNRFSGHSIASIDIVPLVPPTQRDTVTISNNSFPLIANDGAAIAIFNNDGSVITGNVVTGGSTGFGAIFIGGGDKNIVISGNRVTGNAAAAIFIFNFLTSFGVGPNGSVSITGNTLLNNFKGVGSVGNPMPIEMHFNRIVNNTTDVEIGDSAINGANNWYGCNGGAAACGTVSLANASWNLDPWLVMSIAARPSANPFSHPIDVDFNHNSNGAIVSGFPDGTIVSFAGSVAPLSAGTNGGVASTVLAPSGTVSATLDDQTLSITVPAVATIPALGPWMLALLMATLGFVAAYNRQRLSWPEKNAVVPSASLPHRFRSSFRTSMEN